MMADLTLAGETETLPIHNSVNWCIQISVKLSFLCIVPEPLGPEPLGCVQRGGGGGKGVSIFSSPPNQISISTSLKKTFKCLV
jgi:hypothetical protein